MAKITHKVITAPRYKALEAFMTVNEAANLKLIIHLDDNGKRC